MGVNSTALRAASQAKRSGKFARMVNLPRPQWLIGAARIHGGDPFGEQGEAFIMADGAAKLGH